MYQPFVSRTAFTRAGTDLQGASKCFCGILSQTLGAFKIKFIILDNGFNPPKALEASRKLVEEDGVLAEVGTVGTPTNSATQKYLNGKKVPQLLVSAAVRDALGDDGRDAVPLGEVAIRGYDRPMLVWQLG